MPGTQYTPEEITSQGETIYGQRLRDKVEPEHNDEFLVIDIESGAYEIDPNDIEATKRLLSQLSKCRYLRSANRLPNCLWNWWTL